MDSRSSNLATLCHVTGNMRKLGRVDSLPRSPYKIQVLKASMVLKAIDSTTRQRGEKKKGSISSRRDGYATFRVVLVIDRVCIIMECGQFRKIYGCFVWWPKLFLNFDRAKKIGRPLLLFPSPPSSLAYRYFAVKLPSLREWNCR